MRKKIFRIIDANFNRSREGLRVCEDVTRFAMDDEELTRILRMLRHRISTIASDFENDLGKLSGARDTAGDVNRASRIKGGVTRKSLLDIFSANIERVKESVRVLEELFKLIDPSVSITLSRIRFKLYDIEKRVVQKLMSLRYRR